MMINSLSINIPRPETTIEHSDKLLLIGSCFTEHMGKRLHDAKFSIMENPHGILFNPLSVCNSLQQYLQGSPVREELFVYLHEVWHHWDFHSRFSNTDKEAARMAMNNSISAAHHFLAQADWLMITLGSAFQYHLIDGDIPVANCHRAPGQWFDKRLLSITQITEALEQCIQALKQFNPKLKIIFTISPVRHIRDGVIANNRSKARLLEAVHSLVDTHSHCFYFPAYELLIDVLRDYRFYDIDMVHPNFAATQTVWEAFAQHYLSAAAQKLTDKMLALSTAMNHKIQFPGTSAHKKFGRDFLQKIKQYQLEYPHIDFSKEEAYFSGIANT